MASLEYIDYFPKLINVQDGALSWNTINRPKILNLPQIVWTDNTTWAEANLWALDQATSSKKNIKTVRSNMSHLLAYAKWLESESIDWWHFPDRASERCLTRYRGFLINTRNLGEIAPSTTSQRMATVIRFYKWSKEKKLISSDLPMWRDRVVGVKVTNSFGFEQSLRIISTDLAIPNRTVVRSVTLEDGLLPVSASGMKDILSLADRKASIELTLMLKIGFFTGLRIGSITDLKIGTLYNAITIPGTGLKGISIGPGARPPVNTKFDVTGTVPIPEELLDQLIDYSMSTRRLLRQSQAPEENQELLFLTRYGNSYHSESSRAVNVDMYRLRALGVKEGIKVLRGFHFHRTRATYATELMRVALVHMPVAEAIQFVKEACLHKDEHTTMQYIKFIENNKMMSEAANSFTEAFQGLMRINE